MAELQVEIVTPRNVAWKGTASDVQAPGVLGEFGVLPSHIPFLTVLQPGIVTVRAGGDVKKLVVGEGFAEAGPDRVVILVDSCEDLASVDKEAARRDLLGAEEALKSATPGSLEYAVARRKAALARAKIG
jgi:F-type H+-transporting ATPase subunit epsilon